MSGTEQDTANALKYPDFHTWRPNLEDAKKSGRWPDGSLVRLSDPEIQPELDELRHRITNDTEFSKSLLEKIGLMFPKSK